jgi:hypothetical protein
MAGGTVRFSHEKLYDCIFSAQRVFQKLSKIIFFIEIKRLLQLPVSTLTNTKGNYLLISYVLSM